MIRDHALGPPSFSEGGGTRNQIESLNEAVAIAWLNLS
jgi:hypothetical protein